MADTFSSLLGLRYQQTGGNDNTWGELLNTDVFAPLELAITGMASHAVTGGSLDLSASPLVEQVHKFTGVLTSDETVTIPNLQKRMKVWNATSGSFYLLVKTSGGSSVCIPQGTMKDVFCDGANGVYRADKDDVGKIELFAGTSAPSGTFECDGTAVKRTKAPDLYAKIGTTWGPGNGADDFVLPDFKTAGRFLRSRTGSVTVGTLQAEDLLAHNHAANVSFTGSAATITPSGSVSVGTPSGSVSSSVSAPGSFVFSSAGSAIGGVAAGVSLGAGSISVSSTFTGNSLSASFTGAGTSYTPAGSCSIAINNSNGTETRPINASVMMCIRY